jgi:hypothetical protein
MAKLNLALKWSKPAANGLSAWLIATKNQSDHSNSNRRIALAEGQRRRLGLDRFVQL